MARPLKDGVDYWPFDVGLLRDKKIKLIKSEFGIRGVYIALELLNLVYESAGYFKKWDEDDCFLMSEGVGCGCTPELINEVMQGCVRRSLFDKRVFDAFNVLTSAGIQRRYFRIVGNNRDEIRICKEYWLLNEDDKKDVPASVFNKLTFFSVNLTENPIKTKVNTQSKVKESKEDNSSSGNKSPNRKNKSYSKDSRPHKIAVYLQSKILENKPDHLPISEAALQSWADSARLMLAKDKRQPERIRELLDFCQSDDFWKTNILSVPKFRKQFDQLDMKERSKKQEKKQEPQENNKWGYLP